MRKFVQPRFCIKSLRSSITMTQKDAGQNLGLTPAALIKSLPQRGLWRDLISRARRAGFCPKGAYGYCKIQVQNAVWVLCLCWVLSAPAAEAQVLVEQGKVNLSLAPGQKAADTLTIHNTGSEATDLTLYFEDFRYIPPFRGKKEFFPSGTRDDSCSQWINFYPQALHLPAFANKKINYTVNMPEDASGGYYCVLFMEKTVLDGSQGAGQEGSSAGLTILSRIGTLFFIEANTRQKEVSVSGVAVSSSAITGQVTNQGDVTLVITPLFYVLDSASGVPVDRGESQKLYVPAGESAEFEIKLPSEMSDGQYLAVVTLDLEDGVSSVSEIEFQKKGSVYSIVSVK